MVGTLRFVGISLFFVSCFSLDAKDLKDKFVLKGDINKITGISYGNNLQRTINRKLS